MPILTTKWLLPTLLNSNAISIVNKIDEMTEIIEITTVDMVCVTETWLSEEIPPCVTDIDGYTGGDILRQLKCVKISWHTFIPASSHSDSTSSHSSIDRAVV